MREFLKQKKITERITLIIGLLVFALINIVASYFFTGRTFGFAVASDIVSFTQKIEPFDPVEKTEPLKEISPEDPDERFSGFRIVAPVADEPKTGENIARDVSKSQIVTFYGLSLYPNSKVLLEINSDKFFTAVESDDKGKWKWTNYSHPLKNGEHTIKMYNIAPYEIAEKRDIFIQQYSFDVIANPNRINPDNIYVPETAYQKEVKDENLEKQLVDGEAKNIYFFEMVTDDEKEYTPGEDISAKLSFYSLGKNSPEEAKINYALYNYKDDPSKTELVYKSEDGVIINGDNFFEKKISIKDTIFSGNYILKIFTKIGENDYVQAKKIKIITKPIIKIGSAVITEEKFGKLVLFDVASVIIIIILVLVTIVVEFKRFLARRPISEADLKSKGYF